jgi:prepilin signal peptidase PulO-like enzyme (type II secretory pathway)
MTIIYVFVFIFGTIVGSFLNVVILRLKKNESILKNRSHCPLCKKNLCWYELIPIISFLIQLGKCRKCHKKISWQYPLVEFFTGLLFLLAIIYQAPFYGISSVIFFVFLSLVSCLLLVIFVYDLKYYLVPNIIIFPAIILTFVFDLYLWWNVGLFSVFMSSILAAVIAGGFFLILVLISKEKWMGMGDVFIGILIGLILGFPQVLVALFLAFWIGAIFSIFLLLLKKKNLKSKIPFGPFLVLATIISIFWGGPLLNLYLGLF